MSGHHRPIAGGQAARRVDCGEALCAARDRPWVLAATILGSAMGFIDGTLAHIALPAIQADYGARFADLQWVANGYLLTLSALIVVGGGLGDQIGRRRVFTAGVALFAVASALCALAPTVSALIAARALQGVGAALMIPQSLAILAAAYPKELRGAAIGIWASASALTTAFGPVVGGLFVDTLGWRAAFWINLPLAAVTIAIALWRVPESRAPSGPAGGGLTVDWLGAALSAIGLGALSWALIAAPERGLDPVALGALGVGCAALVAFWPVELRARAPIAPPALFRNRDFAAANLLTLALYGGLGAVVFLAPYDLIGRRGFSAAEVGAALLPFGLAIGLLSRWGGAWADRAGPRTPIAVGSLVFAGACLLVGLGGAEAPLWAAAAGFAVMGLGLAAAVAPLTTAVLNAAPEALTGAASGVNNAVSRAAGLVAVAAVGALAAWAYGLWSGSGPARLDQAMALAPEAPGAAARDAALSLGYGACAALGVVSAALASALPGRARADADA